jgi:SIR2-like domain
VPRLDSKIERLGDGLADGTVIPYLGAGVLQLGQTTVPGSQAALAGYLTGKTSVPFKLRTNLTAAAQYVENFKHRKTLTRLMSEAFGNPVLPVSLHHCIAGMHSCPLIVDVWYDDAIQSALAGRRNWGQVQGVSHAEHPGQWYRWLRADGTVATEDEVARWDTLLYKPLGSVAPERNFVVSDSDFVEILTEIDIQTPIPPMVQQRRAGRHFLFMGCRFNTQNDRIFARQIMKRSSDLHWAVLPDQPTRNEFRFLAEQNIERIEMPLADFAAAIERSLANEARAAS